MKRIIRRVGASLVVELPEETPEVIGLGEGASVEVELDREHRQIIITPTGSRPAGVDPEFTRQVAEFIEQYRPALEALAKG